MKTPTRSSGSKSRTRVIVGLVTVLGLASTPALAASFTVASSNLTVFRTCTLTPATGASTGTDATVDQTQATTALGTVSSLTITSRSVNRNARAYVQFDLTKCNPAIPASATVSSALLRIVPLGLANQCRTYDVFLVNAAWSESTITWNNQPFGTAVNNPASATRTASSNIGSAPCTNSTSAYTSGWDITTDVRNIVSGANANRGWMIRDDAEDASSTARTTTFFAREFNNIIDTVQLIVDYKS